MIFLHPNFLPKLDFYNIDKHDWSLNNLLYSDEKNIVSGGQE